MRERLLLSTVFWKNKLNTLFVMGISQHFARLKICNLLLFENLKNLMFRHFKVLKVYFINIILRLTLNEIGNVNIMFLAFNSNFSSDSTLMCKT